MNNGNLLNSLLAITSANPAVTKTTAAKARAESTEKFQQALEQARPDVAARKPAARKQTPPAEASNAARPAPQPAAQRNSRQEMTRANEHARTRADAPDSAPEPVEKTEESARADELEVEDQNEAQAADSQHQSFVGETQKLESEAQVAIDTSLVIDPALIVAGEVGEVFESAENLLGIDDASSPALGDAANEGEMDLTINAGETGMVDPGLLAGKLPLGLEESGASLLSNVAIAPEVPTDAGESDLSPLLAGNPAVPGQVGASLDGDVIPQSMVMVNGSFSAKLVDQIALEELPTEPAQAELSVDADALAGENPDFLLLNSKATLNKLAETAMTAAALDKAAPDLTKPAAIGAAVETLTRLTEAQSPATRAFVVQTGVPVTVGSPQWSQAVGDKVLWLAAQNVSAAEIRLDPPELGPMQVKVSINQDQASVTFTSPHPAVREALDQQLNRLREMFSEQGLNLVNVDVSDKSFAQREREQNESSKNQGSSELDDEELTPAAITQAVSMRLVDHYA